MENYKRNTIPKSQGLQRIISCFLLISQLLTSCGGRKFSDAPIGGASDTSVPSSQVVDGDSLPIYDASGSHLTVVDAGNGQSVSDNASASAVAFSIASPYFESDPLPTVARSISAPATFFIRDSPSWGASDTSVPSSQVVDGDSLPISVPTPPSSYASPSWAASDTSVPRPAGFGLLSQPSQKRNIIRQRNIIRHRWVNIRISPQLVNEIIRASKLQSLDPELFTFLSKLPRPIVVEIYRLVVEMRVSPSPYEPYEDWLQKKFLQSNSDIVQEKIPKRHITACCFLKKRYRDSPLERRISWILASLSAINTELSKIDPPGFLCRHGAIGPLFEDREGGSPQFLRCIHDCKHSFRRLTGYVVDDFKNYFQDPRQICERIDDRRKRLVENNEKEELDQLSERVNVLLMFTDEYLHLRHITDIDAVLSNHNLYRDDLLRPIRAFLSKNVFLQDIIDDREQMPVFLNFYRISIPGYPKDFYNEKCYIRGFSHMPNTTPESDLRKELHCYNAREFAKTRDYRRFHPSAPSRTQIKKFSYLFDIWTRLCLMKEILENFGD